MASYHYMLVYLPEYRRSSFLLYTHHAGGWMNLRDYSQGREVLLPAPPRGKVLQATVDRVTRFPVDPHPVEDEKHRARVISEYNRTELEDAIEACEGADSATE